MRNLKSRLPLKGKGCQKGLKAVAKVRCSQIFREESYINLFNISQKSKLYKTFVKVDSNFFVLEIELYIFDSGGVKHTL